MSKTRYKIDFTLGTGKGTVHIYGRNEQDVFDKFFDLSEDDLLTHISLQRTILSINEDNPTLDNE